MAQTVNQTKYDVICVGMACYDQFFTVDHHPAADEKIFANTYLGCGGGPAANAAITTARLGMRTAFVGFLGRDIYGERHFQEMLDEGIDTSWIIRGDESTPLATIIVKPNGDRALISFKGDKPTLPVDAIDMDSLLTRCVLFDGHEALLSPFVADYCRQQSIPTVLDAGSVHDGTLALLDKVDFLVCSEKFAKQYAGDVEPALSALANATNVVVVTLGERGLVWRTGKENGVLPGFSVRAVDTTGAGDAFHGAFAAAVAQQMDLLSALRYSSAAGALCCSQLGARPSMPYQNELDEFLRQH